MSDYMTTAEVADYIRLKERKVYELATAGRIPCARVTGKWLFPKLLIDQWILAGVEFAAPGVGVAPPVIAGSADPLLEWAVRESGCGLALLTIGSGDGLARLLEGRAVAAGIHLIDRAGGYNRAALAERRAPADTVLIQWAQRTQGLVVAAGNPLGIASLADLAARRLRFARRQEGAGAQALLAHLLARDGLKPADLALADTPASTEGDLAGQVADGLADAGLAVQAAARRLRLGFIPLQVERFDLAMRRRDYFEPPMQALLAFTATAAFQRRARELTGYDVSAQGAVSFNG